MEHRGEFGPEPAVHQAGALTIEPRHTPFEQCRTLIDPRRTLIEPRRALIETSSTLIKSKQHPN
jgi:hypothetical protein